MELSEKQVRVVAVIGVFFIIGLVYFVWVRSAVPEPTIPPGQSLSKPMGDMPPGGPARTGRPDAPSGFTVRNGGVPVNVPAPGTMDPKRGFGPSKGAPIPHSP